MASGAVYKAKHLGKPALSVTWTTPQSDVTISKYQVEYRRQGSSFWRKVDIVVSGLNTTTVFKGLDAGIVYKVRIRAVSAIGNGTWSRVESETTYKSELCSEVKLLILNQCGYYWEDSSRISILLLQRNCCRCSDAANNFYI